MAIRENAVYHDGQVWYRRNEAAINEVRGDIVYYQKVTGWDYGWPRLAERGTMNRQRFAETYPHECRYVQAP